MNRIIALLFLSLTIAISGCATVDSAKSDLGKGTSQYFKNSYNDVWNAALKSLGTLDISVSSSDKSTGTIIASKGVSAFSWGERIALRLTSDGSDQTRVEVVSNRAVDINVTATDWTQEIFKNIGAQLSSTSGSPTALRGQAVP